MGNMPTCDIAIIIVCAGRHGTTERRAGAPGMNTKDEKYLSDHGRFVGQSKPLHILDNGDHKSFFEKEIRRGLQNE